MSNKFLEQYPQLREPQVGDIVKIIKTYDFYRTGYKRVQDGDIGIIEHMSRGILPLRYKIYVKRKGEDDSVGWLRREQFELVNMVDHEK